MNPKMPREYMCKNAIHQLPLCEKFYTVPWAVTVLKDGTCVIDGDFLGQEKPGGTAKLPIIRYATGVAIYPNRVHHFKWTANAKIPDNAIPVIVINGDRE